MAISRKRKIIIGSVIGLLMVGILGASLMAGNREAPEVVTEKVKRVPLLESKVTASGEVRPVKFYNLTAEVNGRITNIYIREGDEVKKGQPLLKVDPTQLAENVSGAVAGVNVSQADVNQQQAAVTASENNVYTIQASLNAAQAEFDRSRADMILAEADFRRNQQLLESGVISRASFEQVEARFNANKATVDAAKARVNQLNTQVKDAQIRVTQAKAGLTSSQARVEQVRSSLRASQDALYKTTRYSPIDGVVSSLPVKEGEFAVANFQTTPLMLIADMSEVNVEVKVDETDIANVRTDQSVKVKVDALGDQEVEGVVTEVGSSAISRSGQTIASNTASQEAKDFKVVVKLLPDNDTRSKLRPGMSATAVVTTDRRESVLVIPLQALVLQEPETGEEADAQGDQDKGKPKEIQGVFRLENNKAVFVPVETGITGDINIEVTSGLGESEEIVTGPFSVLRTLKNNTTVKRAPADSGRGGRNAGNTNK
jgi:HlyD family secretion protein